MKHLSEDGSKKCTKSSGSKAFFEADLKPSRIIRDFSIYLEIKIDPASTLIIFDEIQECPNALTSLKYFCEHAPEYHVVAVGSLLGLKLSGARG
jgi:predicted AAA+ superfamily ATPase